MRKGNGKETGRKQLKMDGPLRLLFIERYEEQVMPLVQRLQHHGYPLVWERADTPDVVKSLLAAHPWDLVFCSEHLLQQSNCRLLHIVHKYNPDLPFIVVADNSEGETIVEMMKAGVQNYIFSHNRERVVQVVENELREARQRSEGRHAPDRPSPLSPDIAEHQPTEASLRQIEQRYREITGLISDAVYSFQVDQDGRLVQEWGAETFRKITGYQPDDIDMENWSNLIYPDDVPIMQQRIASFKVGQPAVSEYRIVTRDGEVRWLRDHGRPVWDEAEGRLVRLYGAVQDITEQKKAEEQLAHYHSQLEAMVRQRTEEVAQREKALRENQALLQGIIDHSPATIYVKDRQRRYVQMSQQAITDMHLSRVQVIGKTDDDIFPSWVVESWRETDQQILNTGETLRFEVKVPLEEGERIFLAVKFPIYDARQTICAIGGIATDITELKRAEEKIHHLNTTLANRAAALEASNAELEAFSHSVAHDLRSPLWAIDLMSETLLEEAGGQLAGEGCQYVERIRANVQQMLHKVDALLNLARFTRSEMQIEPVDLSTLAHEVARELQQSEPARHVEVVIANALIVRGDVRLLRIVLENLLSNAWKFTRNQPHARIEVGVMLQDPQGGIYFVCDNGAGFEGGKKHRLFGAFQRLHNKEEYPGTGIGLATVRRIIHRHGGRIWAMGEVGKGATFFFTLQPERETVEQKEAIYSAQLQEVIARLEKENREHTRINEMLQYREEIIQSVTDAIVSTDEAFTIRSWNRAAETIYGWSAAEVIGKSTLEILKTEYPAGSGGAQAMQEQLYREGFWQSELTQHRKDGTRLPVLSAVSLLRDLSGAIIGSVAVNRDRSEQKRTEAALQASETRFQALVERVPVGVVIGQDGKIIYMNGAAERIFGYTIEEAQQLSVWDVLHPDWHEAVQARYQRRQRGEQVPDHFEVKIITGQGAERWLNVTTIVIDLDGQPSFIVIASDRTTYKQAEEDLQQAYLRLETVNRHVAHSRDLLQAIFDSINDGLLLLDPQGVVRAANPALAALFGCSAEELIQQRWDDLCQPHSDEHPGGCAGFPGRWVQAVLHDGKPRRHRDFYIGKDGKARMLAMHGFSVGCSCNLPDVLQAPDLGSVVLHVVDVTETVKVEALMMENERLATGRKLAEIIAHELNTPLQTILFSLELMPDANEEERTLFVQRTREQIERVGTILHQLKDIYQPSTETHDLFDVTTIIEHVLLLVGGRMLQQHIKVERDLAADVPAVYGSADQMRQALLNVVFNAIEAMDEGGVMTVACWEEDETVFVCITDSGKGIAPAILPHIFQPFFSTSDRGSGLGLFVAQKIIRRHRGTIQIESQPGQGTTCLITLPAGAEPERGDPE